MDDPFPWRHWMRGAFGALHWTPEIFWRSTITEYMLAIEGFNDLQGGSKNDAGPSDGEMATLLEQYGGGIGSQ